MSDHNVNHTFKLSLTTLSPLAINSGLEYSPLSDYFVLDGMVYYVDPQKFQNSLLEDIELQDRYESKIEETKIDGADSFLNELIGTKEQLNAISNVESIPYKGRKTLMLKEVIKLQGQPYIPGSAVKGAIKNAMLYYWLTKVSPKTLENFINQNRNGIIQSIKSRPRIKELNGLSRKRRINPAQKKELEVLKKKEREVNKGISSFTKGIEDFAFGIIKKSKDYSFILRQPAGNLKIADSESVTYQELEIANVTRKSLKAQSWDLYTQEYIKPGVTFHTELQISTQPQDWELFDNNQFFVKTLKRCFTDVQPLIGVLNHFADAVKNIQAGFGVTVPCTSLIKDKEALLFLGSGKGIFRNTILIAIRNYYRVKGWDFKTEFAPILAKIESNYLDFPNSIAHINDSPLGWVKVSI